jgi:CreA protein
MKFSKQMIFAALSFVGVMATAHAGEEIGSVDTEFKMLGANHKIVMEVFDDPMVQGVSCYISRAKTGGFKGTLGLAEDPSDASVACRQVGPIEFKIQLPKQAEVFNQSASVLFKKIRVVRVVDAKRQTLVYLVYGDKLIEGSPKNSITAVPVGKPIPVSK